MLAPFQEVFMFANWQTREKIKPAYTCIVIPLFVMDVTKTKASGLYKLYKTYYKTLVTKYENPLECWAPEVSKHVFRRLDYVSWDGQLTESARRWMYIESFTICPLKHLSALQTKPDRTYIMYSLAFNCYLEDESGSVSAIILSDIFILLDTTKHLPAPD